MADSVESSYGGIALLIPVSSARHRERYVLAKQLPRKIEDQIKKAKLPRSGNNIFDPKLKTDRRGQQIIDTAVVKKGPKRGERGKLDTQGRIWIRDRAHGALPDHWDVQIDDGDDYIRVDDSGTVI